MSGWSVIGRESQLVVDRAFGVIENRFVGDVCRLLAVEQCLDI